MPCPPRTALVDAGDRSFALNAFPVPARFYAQALDLRPERDTERPRVLLAYGRAQFHADEAGKEACREAADEFLGAGETEQAALHSSPWRTSSNFIEGNSPEAQRKPRPGRLARNGQGPPSAIKASVLANRARFHMIADETDQAIPLADEALALAMNLELDELRAHTHDTRGVARTLDGDLGGVEDLERPWNSLHHCRSSSCEP